MNQSNDGGKIEHIVNTVMGVKTEDTNQSLDRKIVPTKELDLKTVLIYKLGTILQIGIIILTFWGMEKLVILVDNSSFFPNWLSTVFAGLFFTLLSIRSRIFSFLDNTRTRKTYDNSLGPIPLKMGVYFATKTNSNPLSSTQNLLANKSFDQFLLN